MKNANVPIFLKVQSKKHVRSYDLGVHHLDTFTLSTLSADNGKMLGVAADRALNIPTISSPLPARLNYMIGMQLQC